MTWVKLDDGFFTHPKAIAAGKDGRALYLAALCWTKQHLTDGIIPKTAKAVLLAQAEVGPRAISRLIDVGLWHDERVTWRINDYHQRNDTADEEKAAKQAHADRMRAWRQARRAQVRDGDNPVTRANGDTSRAASRDTSRSRPRSTSRDAPVTLPDTDTDTDTDTSRTTRDVDEPPSPPSRAPKKKEKADSHGLLEAAFDQE